MTHPTSIHTFLDFAVEAAWRAGQLTLAHFQTDVAVEQKADESEVTIADRGAEELLRRLIQSRFPGHAVVGEEFGETDRDSTYRWIIDPLDGTTNYIHGYPVFAVSIALEHKDEIILGVIYNPLLDELFW